MADINYGIRWFKAHAAEFHSRPDRVGLMGSSSGGHQVMLAGMRPHDPRYSALPLPAGAPSVDAGVRCVVMLWPVIDPLARYHFAKKLKEGGKPYPDLVDTLIKLHDRYWKTEDAMAEGNPALALKRGEKIELPPTMYIQGTADIVHPRVDLDQFLALLDQIALVEIHFHQLAIDPRLDRHVVVSSHVAQPVQINRDAGACDLRHDHRHRAQTRAPAAASAKPSAAAALAGRGGGRLAGTPDRVPCDTRDDQQEDNPDQSSFLRFTGTVRGRSMLAGQMNFRQHFRGFGVCRHSNGPIEKRQTMLIMTDSRASR